MHRLFLLNNNTIRSLELAIFKAIILIQVPIILTRSAYTSAFTSLTINYRYITELTESSHNVCCIFIKIHFNKILINYKILKIILIKCMMFKK